MISLYVLSTLEGESKRGRKDSSDVSRYLDLEAKESTSKDGEGQSSAKATQRKKKDRRGELTPKYVSKEDMDRSRVLALKEEALRKLPESMTAVQLEKHNDAQLIKTIKKAQDKVEAEKKKAEKDQAEADGQMKVDPKSIFHVHIVPLHGKHLSYTHTDSFQSDSHSISSLSIFYLPLLDSSLKGRSE